jgi:hypothetical protein
MNQATSIRAALPEHWPAIWQFMRRIVAAGETFSWEQDIVKRKHEGHGSMTNHPAAPS